MQRQLQLEPTKGKREQRESAKKSNCQREGDVRCRVVCRCSFRAFAFFAHSPSQFKLPLMLPLMLPFMLPLRRRKPLEPSREFRMPTLVGQMPRHEFVLHARTRIGATL